MYSTRQPVVVNNKRNTWPLAAICCLGLLGFMVAGTIVLSLIPVYLPAKDITLKHRNNSTGNGTGTGTGGGTGTVTSTASGVIGGGGGVSSSTGSTVSGGGGSGGVSSSTGSTVSGGGGGGGGVSSGTGSTVSGGVSSGTGSTVSGGVSSGTGSTASGGSTAVTTTSTSSTSTSPTFFLVYSINGNDSTIDTGTLANLLQIEQLLNQLFNLDGVLIITGGQTQTQFVRRRRRRSDLSPHRQKRTIITRVLLNCTAQTTSCSDQTCVNALVTRIESTIRSVTTISGLTLRILSREYGFSTVTRDLTFISLVTSKPAGFNGEPTPFNTFIASSSGEFHDLSVWSQKIIPYGVAYVTIATGVRITLSTTFLDLNVVFLDVYGTLILGSSANESITFLYPTNVQVFDGGVLEDQTSGHQIYFAGSSVLVIRVNGAFIGSNTVLSSYATIPAANSVDKSLTLGSSISGPFTVGVFPDLQILHFEAVVFFAISSGSFGRNVTWLGIIAPPSEIGPFVGGYSVYVAENVTLTLDVPDNFLNIQINFVIVATNGVFQLNSGENTQNNTANGTESQGGGVGVTVNFTISYPIGIFVFPYGAFQIDSSIQNLYLNVNSTICVFPNATYTGVNITHITYVSDTKNTDNQSSVVTTQTGPITIIIDPYGGRHQFLRVEFYSIMSGNISSYQTWLGGLAPYAHLCFLANGCFVQVVVGITLIIEPFNNHLDIYFPVFQINNGSTIEIITTTGASDFFFDFPINFIILPAAQLIFKPITVFYVVPNSAFSKYPGAIFDAGGLTISSYNLVDGQTNVIESYTLALDVSAPFTVLVYLDASIHFFPRIQFATAYSGDFRDYNTWIGHQQLTGQLCFPNVECFVVVLEGTILTTISLNNELQINVALIEVQNNSKLELGADLDFGFIFYYQINILCLPGSVLVDVTRTNEFYLLNNSIITLYPNSEFNTFNITTILSYSSQPAIGNVVDNYQLMIGMPTPFTVAVFLDQSIHFYARVQFITAFSGDFTVDSTWIGHLAPTLYLSILAKGVFILILPEIVLTTESLNNTLTLNVTLIEILSHAEFKVGTTGANSGFTFYYPVNIRVYIDGILEDVTSTHEFYILPDSTITLVANATFIGLDTVIFSYSALPAPDNTIDSYTLGSEVIGPLTIFILDDGSISAVEFVSFLAAESGDIASDLTYVGGLALDFNFCKVADGCLLTISSTVTISTSSLQGMLNTNVKFIIIASDAVLQLGTPGKQQSFAFVHPFSLGCLGTLEDVSDGNSRILVPGDSAIRIRQNGEYRSRGNVTLQPYDTSNGNPYKDSLVLDSVIKAPFTVIVSSSGEIRTRE